MQRSARMRLASEGSDPMRLRTGKPSKPQFLKHLDEWATNHLNCGFLKISVAGASTGLVVNSPATNGPVSMALTAAKYAQSGCRSEIMRL
jgi:hypothetical protein